MMMIIIKFSSHLDYNYYDGDVYDDDNDGDHIMVSNQPIWKC